MRILPIFDRQVHQERLLQADMDTDFVIFRYHNSAICALTLGYEHGLDGPAWEQWANGKVKVRKIQGFRFDNNRFWPIFEREG